MKNDNLPFPVHHVPGGWVGLPDGSLVPASEYNEPSVGPHEDGAPPVEPTERPARPRK